MLRCAICGKQLFTENPKKFFCRDCYKQWKSEILAKTEWIRVCVNDEHRQRRRAQDDKELIHLGSEYEVAEVNGGYRIVPTKDYYKED